MEIRTLRTCIILTILFFNFEQRKKALLDNRVNKNYSVFFLRDNRDLKNVIINVKY